MPMQNNSLIEKLIDYLKIIYVDNPDIFYTINFNTRQNTGNIRFCDPYLTDELYENNILITQQLLQEIEEHVENFNKKIGLTALSLRFISQRMDKDWVCFEIESI